VVGIQLSNHRMLVPTLETFVSALSRQAGRSRTHSVVKGPIVINV
jgi:hypothetical protein